jgi:hypothetical protein
MDATDKMTERLLEWFRNHAPEDGVRIYDDDGVTIGVAGHIQVCKLVAFLLHGDVTHTPGPPPELVGTDATDQKLVQAALQNLPSAIVNQS